MERLFLGQSIAGTVANSGRFSVAAAACRSPVNAALFPFELPKFSVRFPLIAAAKPGDSMESLPSGGLWESNENGEVKALIHVQRDELSLALSNTSFQTLSKDMAMGLVLRAVTGTGWTTGSGLKGPSSPMDLDGDSSNNINEQRWPKLSKSPRRRMRVAFTCNVCGERTTRAINPHAYTDGTVFVQCAGCNIFHKLVDNLKLFHELQGSVFPNTQVTYCQQDFVEHQPYDFLGLDDYNGL